MIWFTGSQSAPRADAQRGRFGALAFLVAILVVVCALGVLFGTEPASLARALDASIDRTFLFVVRPPRVALAALAGGGLALVGAVFQALLRNPLAEPYVLGVSGGAAFGATTAIALGLGAATVLGAALVPAAAFVGGVVATWLVYVVVRDEAGASSGTTILLASELRIASPPPPVACRPGPPRQRLPPARRVGKSARMS